ncbi:MAG: O-antigen ligase family protein [Sedimentisphaerales bacterium]
MKVEQIVDLNDNASVDSSYLESEGRQQRGAKLLRYFVALVFVPYGIVSFVMDIKVGFLALKLSLLGAVCLLLFTPANYPYILGLAITMYFDLKGSQAADEETSYRLSFALVIIILMAVINFFSRLLGNKRNPYSWFDLGSFCLFGIVIISLVGSVLVVNRFIYVQRIVGIISFVCAYYLGQSFLKNLDDFKILLQGLCVGIFTIIWPNSVGYVIHQGAFILEDLYKLRAEVEVRGDISVLIFAFALAYSLSGSGISSRLGRFAFWAVVVPSAVGIMLIQQRAAIFLMVVAMVITFLFSGRRVAAFWTIIVTAIVGSIFFTYAHGVFTSFATRVAETGATASTRFEIFKAGIKLGLLHPMFGIGGGQFRYIEWFEHAHNDAINIFAEHGVIALGFYAIFWIYIIGVALKLRLAKDLFLRRIAALFIVEMACYFGYTQSSTAYYIRGGMLFAFVMGGMTAFYHKYKSETQFLNDT